MRILSDIPFQLDMPPLLSELHVLPGSEDAVEFEKLARQCLAIGKPRAIYKESFVDAKGDDSVTIDGVLFRSRVLRMNMDKAERVFPYITTCGNEFDKIKLASDDPFTQFWLDTIKAAALFCAMRYLDDHLTRMFALGKTSSMSPGAGDVTVWPIEQQKNLFSLFGNVREQIGVELTDSCLMIPNKTVSGIKYPTEVNFEACQLCYRKNCQGRRAPFDKKLWKSTHATAD